MSAEPSLTASITAGTPARGCMVPSPPILPPICLATSTAGPDTCPVCGSTLTCTGFRPRKAARKVPVDVSTSRKVSLSETCAAATPARRVSEQRPTERRESFCALIGRNLLLIELHVGRRAIPTRATIVLQAHELENLPGWVKLHLKLLSPRTRPYRRVIESKLI